MKVSEHRLTQAAAGVQKAVDYRDDAIRWASEQGMSRRKVAVATGLSPARVQQIVNHTR